MKACGNRYKLFSNQLDKVISHIRKITIMNLGIHELGVCTKASIKSIENLAGMPSLLAMCAAKIVTLRRSPNQTR